MCNYRWVRLLLNTRMGFSLPPLLLSFDWFIEQSFARQAIVSTWKKGDERRGHDNNCPFRYLPPPPPPAPLSPKEEGNPGSFRHNVCAGISTTFPPNWSTLFDFVCQLSPVYPLFFFWGATFLSLCRWIGHLTSGQTHRRIPTSKSFKMLYWFVSLMSSRECFPLNIEPIDSIANVAEQLL